VLLPAKLLPLNYCLAMTRSAAFTLAALVALAMAVLMVKQRAEGESSTTALLRWNAASDKDAHAPVSFGHSKAVDEMNSFFDNLPTSGCR